MCVSPRVHYALMVTSELLVPRYPANRSAYCGRPSPPVRSGFRVDIMPYPQDLVLPYMASMTSPLLPACPSRHALPFSDASSRPSVSVKAPECPW